MDVANLAKLLAVGERKYFADQGKEEASSCEASSDLAQVRGTKCHS